MPLGNGYSWPAQHHRSARTRRNVGHICRLDVPVGAMWRKPIVATRAGDGYAHTQLERILFQSHVNRVGWGLSAGSGSRSWLQSVYLRHTLGRLGPCANIYSTTSQRSDRRENHQQRRLPCHGGWATILSVCVLWVLGWWVGRSVLISRRSRHVVIIRQRQDRLLEFPENGKRTHDQQTIIAVVPKATHQRYHLFGHIARRHNGCHRYDIL